ncbi:hypothetical protein TEQG_02632 [Trichophyton equinum CBS 127.97]|uniref:Uncharacterized protein n=1 Tax=Trichophyton equinum (strain ATCC MYA-4606 / CBS 127.97) TaxID=559882 RepID=F2PNY4_TRIEC|nr:hypothetical protein TEQG_02632 [Trichophyton equinum CBS 127.97]
MDNGREPEVSPRAVKGPLKRRAGREQAQQKARVGLLRQLSSPGTSRDISLQGYGQSTPALARGTSVCCFKTWLISSYQIPRCSGVAKRRDRQAAAQPPWPTSFYRELLDVRFMTPVDDTHKGAHCEKENRQDGIIIDGVGDAVQEGDENCRYLLRKAVSSMRYPGDEATSIGYETAQLIERMKAIDQATPHFQTSQAEAMRPF